MSRTFTLLQLRTKVRQRADQENSQFISDTELNGYISASWCELYELMAKSGLPFFESSTTITSDGVAQTYSLPADFFGALKVSWQQNSLQWLGIPELMIQEIDRFPVQSFRALGYRIINSTLALYPIPTAGQVYRVIYIPKPADLSVDTDTIDGIAGWEEYVVVDAAIKCLTKEESDTTALERAKAALVARIQEAAELRAAAAAHHVVEADDGANYLDAADFWPRRGVRGIY